MRPRGRLGGTGCRPAGRQGAAGPLGETELTGGKRSSLVTTAIKSEGSTNQMRECDDTYNERHAFILSSDPSMMWSFIIRNKTNHSKCKVVIGCLIQTQLASLSLP